MTIDKMVTRASREHGISQDILYDRKEIQKLTGPKRKTTTQNGNMGKQRTWDGVGTGTLNSGVTERSPKVT